MQIRLKFKVTTKVKGQLDQDVTSRIKHIDDKDEIAALVQVGSSMSEVLRKYKGKASVKYPYLMLSLNTSNESVVDEIADEMEYGWLEDLGEFTSEDLNLVVRPRVAFMGQKIEIVG